MGKIAPHLLELLMASYGVLPPNRDATERVRERLAQAVEKVAGRDLPDHAGHLRATAVAWLERATPDTLAGLSSAVTEFCAVQNRRPEPPLPLWDGCEWRRESA